MPLYFGARDITVKDMSELLSSGDAQSGKSEHRPKWDPNPPPFIESAPKTITVPPEAKKAVDLGNGQHFDEMNRREEHQRNHQQSAQ